jgi:hypothetical protein
MDDKRRASILQHLEFYEQDRIDSAPVLSRASKQLDVDAQIHQVEN